MRKSCVRKKNDNTDFYLAITITIADCVNVMSAQL